ncbi:MAG: hypothetical protein IKE01_01215 [Clostridia bacterium]|nr:hypothetical protein [Clostridia bacterium]
MADKSNNKRTKSLGVMSDSELDEISQIISNHSPMMETRKDIESNPELYKEILNALINPKYVQFIRNADKKTYTCRLKLKGGVTKDYEMYTIIDILQRYVENGPLKNLHSIKLAYLKEYEEGFVMPEEDMYKKAVKEAIDLMDDYVKHDSESKNIDENDVEEIDEIRKNMYARCIIQCFLQSFLTIHNFSKAFEKCPIAPQIEVYRKSGIDTCVNLVKGHQILDEDMKKLTLSMVFRKTSTDFELISENIRQTILSDQDVIKYLEEYIGKDGFFDFMKDYADCVVERKGVIEYLTGSKQKNNPNSLAGIITFDEYKNMIDQGVIENIYNYNHNRELIPYLSTLQILWLYSKGEIEDRDLRRNTTLKSILEADVDRETQMEVLTKKGKDKLFSGTESELIWKLFEDEHFWAVDVKELESAKYFDINDVIRQYEENQKRKIASELGECQVISDEHLFEYFTPDKILEMIDNGTADKNSQFFKDTLKDIYEKFNIELELSLVEEIERIYKDDRSGLVKESLMLLENGYINAVALHESSITEDDIIKYYEESGCPDNVIIELFNNGVISSDTAIELIDADIEERGFKLISNGMSASILEGFYSTADLIAMTRPSVDENGKELSPMLTYENLAEIKSDIITGLEDDEKKSGDKTSSLLDLYLAEELRYSELYGLANAGVISIEEANAINEKYNIIKDWEELKKIGIKGSPIDGLNPPPIPGPDPIPSVSRGPVGIDEECIIDFYIDLGATEYLKIDAKKCPVFKKYIIIPVIEKRVAYLESQDGRTYIVPIKIVLEQINNPNGDLDLMGNASSRNGFNRQKDYVRSVNHRRNWGRKIVEKTAELPSVRMSKEEAKEFIKSHQSSIKAIEDSYDKRKYERE